MVGRPFKPGVSGNRAGRPKGSKNKYGEIQKLCQMYSVEAVEKLVVLMRNVKNPSLAMKASEAILDRGLGKVAQAITGEGGEGPVRITYEVVRKWGDREVIDVTPKQIEGPDGENQES
jgi:hypothetical protein